MAVYYKFMSAKDFSTINLDGPCISVANLKREILKSKYKSKNSSDSNRKSRDPNGLCLGTDFGFRVINAQTNEEYVNDSDLISRNASVLLRRVPGNRHGCQIDTTPIVVEPPEMGDVVSMGVASGSTGSSSDVVDSDEDTGEWSLDFGEDVLGLSGGVVAKSSNIATLREEEDEDAKIKALVNTPALVYSSSGYSGQGDKGFRRMGGGCRFGGLEGRTPPEGYVCHRCNVPGHFIQHCPTNGDPNYDVKRVRPPTGIPKSMLVVNADGSYKLPGGVSAVLKPNEDAFDKEMSGISSSSRSSCITSVPPELFCPLCKQVMKDAVLTSKCCFKSFCDKCIRDHLINAKLKCVCGVSNVLTDSLVPNMTLRDTIKRILESGSCSSSSDNVTSAIAVPEMDSACHLQVNNLAPALQTTDRKRPLPANTETGVIKIADSNGASHHPAKKSRRGEPGDVSKAVGESAVVQDEASDKHHKDEVQQKLAMVEAGKQRKKKKSSQGALESNMMPMESYGYDQYWKFEQPWIQGYISQCANVFPYNDYGMNSFEVPLFNAQDYVLPSAKF